MKASRTLARQFYRQFCALLEEGRATWTFARHASPPRPPAACRAFYNWYRPGGRLGTAEMVAELTELASRVLGLRTAPATAPEAIAASPRKDACTAQRPGPSRPARTDDHSFEETRHADPPPLHPTIFPAIHGTRRRPAVQHGHPRPGTDSFKIAFIDPLSGPFVSTGELMRDHVQYAVEDVNAKGGLFNGAKLQLLQFDSKLSAQESQAALQAAQTRARAWW